MYDQIRESTLYIMLYAAVSTLSLIASCYLLFRRANAIAPNVTPPARLRRWTATFFAFLTLCHLWYMPIFFLTSDEDIMMVDLVGGLIDCMTVFPTAIIVLLNMLQDYRRPLWPVAVMMLPLIVGGAINIATLRYDFLIFYIYFLLMCIGLIIYMVRSLKRYGRWLRDNYADLEHKEVWQSFVVLAIILLVFVVYALVSKGPVYQYAMQVICGVLTCYLLWRVETLSDLSIPQLQSLSADETAAEDVEFNTLSNTLCDNITSLLQKNCIDTQLYLQHDLTLILLAKAVGTNRYYLSQYFSLQGITYNTYINDLRINHFMRLYSETFAAQQPVTAQQLASKSGYRSYSTFSLAFKQRTGMSVTAWIRSLS